MVKGQLKIQQTAFMLIGVIFFFVLVGMFLLATQFRNFQQQANELEQERASYIARFITGLSEFSCGDFCVDTDRMLILEDRSIYKEFFPVAYIKLRKMSSDNEIKCSRENYPDCNLFEVYENNNIESSSSTSSFVALCRHEKLEDYPIQVCELGKIIIGYEVK